MAGLVNDERYLRKMMSGDDISQHYLDTENRDYKIVRYNKVVYAIRLNEDGTPNAAAEMWQSHKGEDKKIEQEALGRGIAGIVKEKTADKAVKSFKSKLALADAINSNQEILKQKFFLAEKGLDSIFIFGLHNIKNSPNIVFNMPKVDALINYSPDGSPEYGAAALVNDEIDEKYAEALSEETIESNTEKFFVTLKQVNDCGYYHPDYATGLNHKSFQNQLYSSEGFKLFDLDSGLSKVQEVMPQDEAWLKEIKIAVKDQWLIVYNRLMDSDSNEWKTQLKEFYKNNNCAISDKPEVLLELNREGKIEIPERIKAQLLLDEKNTKLAISGEEEKWILPAEASVPPEILNINTEDMQKAFHDPKWLVQVQQSIKLETGDEEDSTKSPDPHPPEMN